MAANGSLPSLSQRRERDMGRARPNRGLASIPKVGSLPGRPVVIISPGGERGIRTLGGRLTLARFPSVYLKPLGHLS